MVVGHVVARLIFSGENNHPSAARGFDKGGWDAAVSLVSSQYPDLRGHSDMAIEPPHPSSFFRSDEADLQPAFEDRCLLLGLEATDEGAVEPVLDEDMPSLAVIPVVDDYSLPLILFLLSIRLVI